MRRSLIAGLVLVAISLVRVGEHSQSPFHLVSPAFGKEGGEGGSGGGGSGSDGGGDDGGGDDGGGDDGGSSDDSGDDRGDDDEGEDDEDQDRGFFGGLFGGGSDRGGRDNDFRRGEILGVGLTAAENGALAGAGFRPVAAYDLSALGQTVTRMRVPLGLGSEEALAAAEAIAPNAVFELNHLYSSEGTACDPDACWPSDLVGFAPLAADACTAAPPVAIVDTTVNRWHPALVGARIVARSFVDGGAEPAPAGHGTAIAALLVGRPGEARPLIPGGELLVAESFGREEKGDRADALTVLRGLDWAVASGAKIVGLSLAGAANRVLEQGIAAAARQATIVAAGGNGGPNAAPAYPAAYPDVIAVAAVDARQRPYRRGTRGAYIDLSAPGVKIRSADANGGTTAWTGTSFSVPFVMAALMRARAETGGDAAAALSLVERTARDLGAPGRDEVYGVGLVRSSGDGCR